MLLEEGYARMSIARVAEEARVGRPAIYRRYRDKSELVAAVLADKQASRASGAACWAPPPMADIGSALERGKERGEVRPDLDIEVAVQALMGAFMFHRIAEGQPKKGWSEHVVDQLWPAFAA